MKYSNIKSPYIKSHLIKTKWQDRQYIDDLVQLHTYMTKGINSWVEASLFSDLTYRYKKEYLILIREDIDLYPNAKRIKMYPKKIYELKQRNKKIHQWKKEEFKMQKKLKKDWMSAGGKKI